jgi:exonuclease III
MDSLKNSAQSLANSPVTLSSPSCPAKWSAVVPKELDPARKQQTTNLVDLKLFDIVRTILPSSPKFTTFSPKEFRASL